MLIPKGNLIKDVLNSDWVGSTEVVAAAVWKVSELRMERRFCEVVSHPVG